MCVPLAQSLGLPSTGWGGGWGSDTPGHGIADLTLFLGSYDSVSLGPGPLGLFKCCHIGRDKLLSLAQLCLGARTVLLVSQGPSRSSAMGLNLMLVF